MPIQRVQLAALADGVVVGSALIEQIESSLDSSEKAIQAVEQILKSMRAGLDSI